MRKMSFPGRMAAAMRLIHRGPGSARAWPFSGRCDGNLPQWRSVILAGFERFEEISMPTGPTFVFRPLPPLRRPCSAAFWPLRPFSLHSSRTRSRPLEAGGDGGWDYLLADSAAHRLYLTRGARVDVVDHRNREARRLHRRPSRHARHRPRHRRQVRLYLRRRGNAVVVFDRSTWPPWPPFPPEPTPTASSSSRPRRPSGL